jgi:hypothetical protein
MTTFEIVMNANDKNAEGFLWRRCKIYNATSSLVHFELHKYFLLFYKTLQLTTSPVL